MANITPVPILGAVTESDPLFLAANESPAVILVTPLLNGKNYHSWSRSIQLALHSKNKLRFIDGSITRPVADDSRFSSWDRCNTMVISWICLSVEPTISQSILWFKSASALWKNLKESFGRGESMQIASLQEQIYNLRQGALSVNDYYINFQILWDQLLQLRVVPSCKCVDGVNGGLCGGNASMSRPPSEGDQVMCFLRGLNDNYNGLRSQILMLDPLPLINRVLSPAGEHEMQILHPVMAATSPILQSVPSSPVLAAQGYNGNKRPWNGGVKRPQCTYCGVLGHTIDKCFKKHGFPPGYRPQGFNPSMSRPPSGSGYSSVNQVGYCSPSNFGVNPSLHQFGNGPTGYNSGLLQ